MSSTSIQQLKEIGESMGLKGPELMNFVREQQTLEREKQREKEKQDKEKEDERLEIEQKAKEDERKEKLMRIDEVRGGI